MPTLFELAALSWNSKYAYVEDTLTFPYGVSAKCRVFPDYSSIVFYWGTSVWNKTPLAILVAGKLVVVMEACA